MDVDSALVRLFRQIERRRGGNSTIVWVGKCPVPLPDRTLSAAVTRKPATLSPPRSLSRQHRGRWSVAVPPRQHDGHTRPTRRRHLSCLTPRRPALHALRKRRVRCRVRECHARLVPFQSHLGHVLKALKQGDDGLPGGTGGVDTPIFDYMNFGSLTIPSLYFCGHIYIFS